MTAQPVRVPPDVEALVVTLLEQRLAEHDRTEQVGTQLPAGWNAAASPMFVQVASDGAPQVDYPVRALFTVRVVVWSKDPSPGKALAALCLGLLLSHRGSPQIPSIRDGLGLVTAKDPGNLGHLASVTVTVGARLVEA